MNPIKLISFTDSPLKTKRYRIELFINGKIKKYDFGYKTGSTYIDHHNTLKRDNYLKRHKALGTENWDEINAGSLSAYLLWGAYKDLEKNLKYYMKKFNITY